MAAPDAPPAPPSLAAAHDHLFPRYHLRPATGYVNDPNGPVRFGGAWHLYFQYSADTAQREPVVWGHATSPDLVRWRLHRPAVTPHPGSADADGCWSGSTVATADGLLAFYSGHRADRPHQSVLVARSGDGGRTFGPPVPAVRDPGPSQSVATFRDPFVWRDGDAWSMAVGSGDTSGRPAVRLYRSSDLHDWRFRGSLLDATRVRSTHLDLGEMWECPQVLPLGESAAVLVGTWRRDRGIGAALALLGARDADGAIGAATASRLDHGPDFYAPSLLTDGPDGPTLWGWVTEGRTPQWAVEAGWSGVISLPRVVRPGPGGRLALAPVPALASLRTVRRQATTAGGGTAVVERLGAQFELGLRPMGDPSPGASTDVTLVCGARERLRIVVDRSAARITVDRREASDDLRARRDVWSFDEPELRSGSSVRVFVDGSVAELFTGSGRAATFRLYPVTPPPWRLVVDGTGQLEPEIWELGCATS